MRHSLTFLLLFPALAGCVSPAGIWHAPEKLTSHTAGPGAMSRLLAHLQPSGSAAQAADPLLRAQELYRQGNPQACRTTLREARRRDPRWTAGFALEAAVAIDLGERDEAVLMLESAALANPQSASVQFSTGALLVHFGNARSGLRALERAAMLDPLNTHYTQELAAAYAGFGNLAAAESVLESALEIHENDRTLLLSLARIAEAGSRWRKAEICYELALRDAQENPLFRRQRARSLYRLGEFELAVAEFAACGEEFARNGPVFARLEYEDARRRSRENLAVARHEPARMMRKRQAVHRPPASSTMAHARLTERLRQPDRGAFAESPYRRALIVVDPS